MYSSKWGPFETEKSMCFKISTGILLSLIGKANHRLLRYTFKDEF